MTDDHPLLARTVAHATRYLDSLPDRPVAASATATEVRDALSVRLSEDGEAGRPADQFADEVVRSAGSGAAPANVRVAEAGSTALRARRWDFAGPNPPGEFRQRSNRRR